ncbi:glycosyltransferase family 4 protein [Allorhizobium undicola]|uniref:glycosyltransferase family 4 protein n=1 Tax=Allorhizobium undicola TaxID=78527 RepID=UPI0013772AE5|nr:glycosyltransferase family 4 protein [Allorhizobium undicola]
MKILFFNMGDKDFDPQTPLHGPLGGTESAIAYLTAALARQGCAVTLVSRTDKPRVVDGVRVVPLTGISPQEIDAHDLVCVISVAAGSRIKMHLKLTAPMVLWCHMAIDQPTVQLLDRPEEQAAWDGYVMVSEWQSRLYRERFKLEPAAVHVIGNAISPAFAAKPLAPAWFETGAPPTLLYSSTPYRGLDRLLMSFPAIRARVPQARLKIFAGMALYGADPVTDRYRYLYDLTRALEGADYIGPVGQAELSEAYGAAAALAYPSSFPETSCITVMEAMASGADVLTTDMGALKETLAGFGRMIAPEITLGKLVQTPTDIMDYVDMVVDALAQAQANPAAAAAERQKRAGFAREHYSWDARARQWIALAEGLAAKRRAA